MEFRPRESCYSQPSKLYCNTDISIMPTYVKCVIAVSFSDIRNIFHNKPQRWWCLFAYYYYYLVFPFCSCLLLIFPERIHGFSKVWFFLVAVLIQKLCSLKESILEFEFWLLNLVTMIYWFDSVCIICVTIMCIIYNQATEK